MVQVYAYVVPVAEAFVDSVRLGHGLSEIGADYVLLAELRPECGPAGHSGEVCAQVDAIYIGLVMVERNLLGIRPYEFEAVAGVVPVDGRSEA